MNSKPAHPWKPGFRNLILPAVLFMASALAINAQNADVSTQGDLETAIGAANTGTISPFRGRGIPFAGIPKP